MTSAAFTTDLARLGPAGGKAGWSLSASRAYCQRLARTHYENFRVASWLLPRSLREHFYAIYAYCRWSDDLADETRGGAATLDLLAWWHEQLIACYHGQARHPVFVALAETIRQFNIPIEPFADLLVAFRQDQTKHRYQDRHELLDYCRHSACPVGRLVLYLARSVETRNLELSDSICTGLQLANFWQDIARDWRQGRRYLPDDTMRRHDCSESMFQARQATAAFRAALAEEVEVAERMLRAGFELIGRMPTLFQLEVWLFIQGGLAILERIRAQDYDVWSRRPTVSRGAQLRLLAGGCWRRWSGRLSRTSLE
jgi:squalene synthase HpnC